mmetsp:Transcript_100040/g.198448  ORF Transcript_100040/g.198448 Transcript_100040/m.198448 type:complete len:82 (-) Transcript_100040:879-1124(-)
MQCTHSAAILTAANRSNFNAILDCLLAGGTTKPSLSHRISFSDLGCRCYILMLPGQFCGVVIIAQLQQRLHQPPRKLWLWP